jgi:hypothetical protein
MSMGRGLETIKALTYCQQASSSKASALSVRCFVSHNLTSYHQQTTLKSRKTYKNVYSFSASIFTIHEDHYQGVVRLNQSLSYFEMWKPPSNAMLIAPIIDLLMCSINECSR